jgi:uncharacterized protein YegP (UPF0339 family)
MFARRWLFVVCGAAVAALTQMPALAQAQERLKFEIYQDAGKGFRWRLKAANGEILATAGEAFVAKADAQKGVDRMKAEAATDKLTFESYEDDKKEFRWRLKAANGQVVATSSQGYKAKADSDKAIDLIKKGAAQAQVEDRA